MFRQCQNPRKCNKDGCTVPTIRFSMELRGFIYQNPLQPTVVILMLTPFKVDLIKSPSKTTTFSSESIMKGFLKATELQLTSSSGKYSTALFLCYTACSNLGCPIMLQIDLVCTVQY